MLSFKDLNLKMRKRFWLNVDRTESCWIWAGRKTSDGYGEFKSSLGGKMVRGYAHRIAYVLSKRTSLDSQVILRHTCDNPSCVNPAHLKPGTHRDNVMDRVERNRSACGEGNGRSKLTSDQVIAIYKAWERGAKVRDLSRIALVAEKTVARIVAGTGWRSVLSATDEA